MANKIFNIVAAAFLLTIIIMIAAGICVTLIDSYTVEHIGTEKVKCIDKEGNVFVDEFCDKKVYCSRFGFVTEHKCSEVER